MTTKEEDNDSKNDSAGLQLIRNAFGSSPMTIEQRQAACFMLMGSNVLLYGQPGKGRRWITEKFVKLLQQAPDYHEHDVRILPFLGQEKRDSDLFVLKHATEAARFDADALTTKCWIIQPGTLGQNATVLDWLSFLPKLDFFLQIRRRQSQLFGGCQIIALVDTTVEDDEMLADCMCGLMTVRF